ncbi:MAG: RNA methyltransferase [Gemmatimonadetes bacterium]|uniref:tRNA (cytidine/uridine-2'-O-)-methyltransferase TrmJ n=1 Tax=Candidatus Kutchimonas denitrificans TaxID=3056748 RepID=A0AAE4ZA34_9BACT|nr:RNA methyltransferase [Gemmatimonadota bacterium]NIR74886.1 RNA methyltransferase [Candidatus Kutchimonas denitrificans]NIR99997.1 RNA methyltransferase [Gemmatimonadota bacterium]NIT65581.1 RNA methyltransferase [Gemmatimonadota bacterium]NIU52551.1 TrmJ/YjtD family RNA methyltransferase [Gemmatimonadota bacterium]
MAPPQELGRIVLVLNRPKDPVNIGAVVRAMKNMGLSRLYLIDPDDFDTYRIEGIAHTGMDIIGSARLFDSLAEAVADSQLVVGTSARGRTVRRAYRRPREQAAEVLAKACTGQEVALVFGREDRGLSNEELDLCDRVVVIPTDPDHASLNLAQAVLVVAYEIAVAAEVADPFKAPRHDSQRATRMELEELFEQVEKSLHAIDFFKAHRTTAVLRTLRSVAGRADLDGREVELLKAIAYEVRHFLAREGIEVDE